VGRLLGAALLGFFVGMMIALAEQLAREGCLVAHWSANEKKVISLGPTPVILGSSPEAHIYLPKEKGYLPITATVVLNAGKVEFEDKLTGNTTVLKHGSKLQVDRLMLEIQTDVRVS
jgi:Ca-activated chloride channel family protein